MACEFLQDNTRRNQTLPLLHVDQSGDNSGHVSYFMTNQIDRGEKAGTAYVVNWRLYLVLLILNNNLGKMQCFWRSPIFYKLWRIDTFDKEGYLFVVQR